MAAKRKTTSQELAQLLGLTAEETAKVLDDPQTFVTRYLEIVQAKHLDQADRILKAMERKAKEGDVKAAECWFKFMRPRHAPTPATQRKLPASKNVDSAMKWLPGPTVEAKIIERAKDDLPN